MGISHICHSAGLTTPCSLKGASLKQLQCGNSGQNIHSKDKGWREEPPIAQACLRSSQGDTLLITSNLH